MSHKLDSHIMESFVCFMCRCVPSPRYSPLFWIFLWSVGFSFVPGWYCVVLGDLCCYLPCLCVVFIPLFHALPFCLLANCSVSCFHFITCGSVVCIPSSEFFSSVGFASITSESNGRSIFLPLPILPSMLLSISPLCPLSPPIPSPFPLPVGRRLSIPVVALSYHRALFRVFLLQFFRCLRRH